MKKIKIPNENQEKELCEIILSGGQIHNNIKSYLKSHNLTINTRDRSYSIKTLVRKLIDKYELNKDRHIDLYDCLYPLTQQELDVIIGGLLGDTWIGYLNNARNPCGSFTHKLEHYEYAEYKYNLIKRRCSEITIHNKTDKRSNRKYQQVFCKIASSEVLIPIQQSFYPNGIKIIPEDLIWKLSPLGIAIWFMDDGASDNYGYKLSVDCFEKEDIEKLTKMLKLKFEINSTININQNKTIHIKSDSTKKFKELVEPYICDCMKYKLKVYKKINTGYIKTDI